MATILKSNEREFKEDANKIDNFRLFSDISRVKRGINPENLNFDLHQLPAGQFCSAYHFHRYAEEFFLIISGSATLRTPKGLKIVNAGDLIFFEKGETGASYTTTRPSFVHIWIYGRLSGMIYANILILIKYSLSPPMKFSVRMPG